VFFLAAAVVSDRCPICGRAGATVNLSPPQKSGISPTCRAVEDVFRDHARMAPANASHGQPGQCNLRSAIEHCRIAALGGISKRCEKCLHTNLRRSE
jgi:hypothetical protein